MTTLVETLERLAKQYEMYGPSDAVVGACADFTLNNYPALIAALRGRDEVADVVKERNAVWDEFGSMRDQIASLQGTLLYLKTQAENGTLHNQVVIQNVRAALKEHKTNG